MAEAFRGSSVFRCVFLRYASATVRHLFDVFVRPLHFGGEGSLRRRDEDFDREYLMKLMLFPRKDNFSGKDFEVFLLRLF